MDTKWIEEITIEQLKEKLDSGEVTSRKLVLTYLKRIAEIDSSGASLHSIIEVNPEALYLADKMDRERQNGKDKGVLHGIPIVVKDNINTHDKMHTTGGSLLLKDHYAKKDAFLVKQLRQAGAIILAKTNLTEWANFIAEDMPTGYSSYGGQTLNPYGKEFMVGGSSAGTGAAVAANLAAAGIGTETSGSILSPASQNSLVGVKPTVGLISRSGVIPISSTQDTAGPMTRTVKDAAILLNVLQGVDEKDPVTGTNQLGDENFVESLQPDGLQGKRIGIWREPAFTYLNEEKEAIMNHSIEKLQELGAEVKEVKLPSHKEEWTIDVMLYEFKAAIESYLSTVENTTLNTLDDLIKGNRKIGAPALKYGQALFHRAAATSGRLTDSEYLEALIHDQINARDTGIDATLKEKQVDVFITPNNYGAAIPAKAGYPSITVPAGYTEKGEPVGITFTGTAYSEPLLLSCAYAFEQGTQYREAPKI